MSEHRSTRRGNPGAARVAHRRSPQPLAVAVDSLAGALIPATPLALVQQVWPSVVAALPIAHEASPTSVRDGVLNVTCSSSVYTEELALLATDVVSAVNGAVGEPIVRSLRARTG